jgi:hypothetical protein
MANTTSLTGLSKDILREKYILEGFQFYLETFHPEHNNLLLEADSIADISSKITDSKEKKRFDDLILALGILFEKDPSEEFRKLLQDSIKELIQQGKDDKEIIQIFKNPDSNLNEAQNKTKSLIGYLANKGKNFARAVTLVVALAVGAKTFQNNINNKIVFDKNKIEQTAKVKATSDNFNNTTGNYIEPLEKQGVDLPDVDDNPDEDTAKAKVGVNMDYGKGTQLDEKAKSTLDDLVNKIVKHVQETGKEVNLKVAGAVSNTTGDDEKATDTNKKLSDARADTIIEYIQDGLEKQLDSSDLSKVKIGKTTTGPVEDQRQEKVGGDEASGGIIHLETDVNQDLKLDWKYWPEAAKYDGGIPGNSETARDITPIPPVAGDDFSKLNRNGQIATVLASIDPKLNIAQYKEIGPIKSYTDNELLNPNIKDEKAKELARLIVNIRKNPNSLLKKVSKATGLPFNVRAKAVSTRASKSTQAQLQSPTVKETQELFQEALVDDIFTKLGIQDSDLAKNKIKLAGYLGSMYAKEGDTDLSILDTDKLSDDDKKELQKVGFGFTPQSGKNYVFLKGRSAADVGAVRKIKPDVKRALDAVAQRKNELESYFNNIQNRKEFAGVIVGIIKYFEIRLQQDIAKLRGALQKLRTGNYIAEAINDPSSEIDVQKLIGRIEKNTFLVNALKNISDEQELIQFLAGMSTYVTKVKPADKKGAFQDAENVLILLSKQNKPTGGTGQTNEMQRMQELAGIKTR